MTQTTHRGLLHTAHLHRWLDEDAQKGFSQRQQRDHAIGQRLRHEQPGIAGPDLVHAWTQQTLPPPDTSWQHAARLQPVLGIAAWIIGLVTGTGVTTLALAYTGDAPVNVLILLAAVLGLPTLGLLPIGWRGLQSIFRRRPTHRHLLLHSILRRNDNAHLNYLGQHLSLYATALYWHTQKHLQYLNLGYMLSAMVVLLLSVTLQDIAFGWSSTLQLAPQTVHTLLAALAIPWSSWLPEASPTLQLVIDTRYYRIDNSVTASHAQLGAWWPFLLCCIAFWGLLPRLALLAIAARQAHKHNRLALMRHPQVSALLDRLCSHIQGHSSTAQPARHAAATDGTAPPAPAGKQACHLSWNGADTTAALAVDGLQSGAERQQLLQQLPAQLDQVVVHTKGWEPPTGELIDFLRELRAVLETDVHIVVQPHGLPDADLEPDDWQIWQQTISSQQGTHIDPLTYVAQGHEVSP